jgi:calmodulin
MGKKAAAKKAAGAPKPTKEQTAEIMTIFTAYDKNGDGTISKDELKTLLLKLDESASFTDKQLDSMMSEMNLSHNAGGVVVEDFVLWIMSQPKAKDRDQVREAAKLADSGGPLDDLIHEIFSFVDENQDGEIERVEMLTAEEINRKGDFQVKQRKEVVQWFKEAGATGDVTNGLYLSPEKFNAAMKEKAAKNLEEGVEKTDESLIAWLEDNYAELLKKARKPKAAPKEKDFVMPKDDSEPLVAPEYPLKIKYRELNARMDQAQALGKSILIFASSKERDSCLVETFRTYQTQQTFDCKAAVVEVFMKKSKTKEDITAEAKKALSKAMNSSGFCQPLWFRLNNSAFDFNSNFTEDLPRDIFGGQEMWTIEKAFSLGFFDESHKFNVEIENGKKWKDFQVITTSVWSLEEGKQHLGDKIPNWDKLAILEIDPTSYEE